MASGLLCLFLANASEGAGRETSCLSVRACKSHTFCRTAVADEEYESQHAWWHLGTGLGGYWLTVALQLLVVSIKEDPKALTLKHTRVGGLPYVARITQKPLNGHDPKHD
jgi:hypothetical protein